MTVRDKIMDKYWLEFLASARFSDMTSEYVGRIDNFAFWRWFFTEKVSKATQPLEDYLK